MGKIDSRFKGRSGGAGYAGIFLFLTLAIIFFCNSVSAHRVSIFAWVEGDTVYTESKFSGGKKVRNAEVVVFDEADNELVEGRTDEDGRFSFKVPRKTGLKVVLKASMGHLAEWTIPMEDFDQPAVPSEGITEKQPEKSAKPLKIGIKNETDGVFPPTQPEIERLIELALDRKLAPVIKMLVDLQDRSPGMREVIGGLGYIIGLVGVALYLANRKKPIVKKPIIKEKDPEQPND